MNNKPCLYIFSGLPGSGKTTLCRMLARERHAVYLRIDSIEQGLRDLCSFKVEGEGYRLTYRVATDNLMVGNSVIADSCNPIKLTRDEWEEIAKACDCRFVNIEVHCSSPEVHQKRIETRQSDIVNLRLPNWKDVQKRDYESWDRERITIDTANRSPEQSFHELIDKITKIENWPNK